MVMPQTWPGIPPGWPPQPSDPQPTQPATDGPGPPYVPVPNNPGLYYIPGTNYVVSYEAANPADPFGEPSISPLPLSVGKALLGDLGSADTGSGPSYPPAHTDPRYWDLQYQQLYQDAINNGLDAESARRQALTSLITNRNNTAVDVANTSANVAKTAAEFAANPRDAVAELIFRNQVGGTVPFGDLTNDNFGEYGKALAEKGASIFQPVAADLNQARTYRDSIPPLDFLGPEQRQSLGLDLTPAQQLSGSTGVAAPVMAGSPAPQVNGLQALMDRLNAMNPEEQDAFRRWTDPSYRSVPKMDMGGVIKSRTSVGEAPTSTEGGLNINLFEPAMVVGMDSGKVYATVAEPRPDGTRRGEQLVVKPLKSETEKDKKLAEGNKAVTQSFGVPKAAEGGVVNATPDDFMAELQKYLQSLGGAGGGTGSTSTPLPSPRLLAGAPYNALLEDPDALAYTQAGFSALGISPASLAASVAKFTPKSAQLVGQTGPRVNYL